MTIIAMMVRFGDLTIMLESTVTARVRACVNQRSFSVYDTRTIDPAKWLFEHFIHF